MAGLKAGPAKIRLAQEGFPFARYVTYAILLDRIFRFPVTGPRVRKVGRFVRYMRADVEDWLDRRAK